MQPATKMLKVIGYIEISGKIKWMIIMGGY